MLGIAQNVAHVHSPSAPGTHVKPPSEKGTSKCLLVKGADPTYTATREMTPLMNRRKNANAIPTPGGVLEDLRALCLSLPETSERTSWGHPNFLAGKKTLDRKST